MIYLGLTFLKLEIFVVVFGMVIGKSKFKQEGKFFHFFYFSLKTYLKWASFLFAYLKSILKYKYKNLKEIHRPSFRNLSLYNMKCRQSLGTEIIISALLKSKHWNSSQCLVFKGLFKYVK